MTVHQAQRPGHDGGSPVEVRPEEGHAVHEPMGHSHGGHLLHMVPMVLVLFAPRLGWPLTVDLLAVFGVYAYFAWRKRMRARMAVGKALVPRPEERGPKEGPVAGLIVSPAPAGRPHRA